MNMSEIDNIIGETNRLKKDLDILIQEIDQNIKKVEKDASILVRRASDRIKASGNSGSYLERDPIGTGMVVVATTWYLATKAWSYFEKRGAQKKFKEKMIEAADLKLPKIKEILPLLQSNRIKVESLCKKQALTTSDLDKRRSKLLQGTLSKLFNTCYEVRYCVELCDHVIIDFENWSKHGKSSEHVLRSPKEVKEELVTDFINWSNFPHKPNPSSFETQLTQGAIFVLYELYESFPLLMKDNRKVQSVINVAASTRVKNSLFPILPRNSNFHKYDQIILQNCRVIKSRIESYIMKVLLLSFLLMIIIYRLAEMYN